jgi:hypothetical protein
MIKLENQKLFENEINNNKSIFLIIVNNEKEIRDLVLKIKGSFGDHEFKLWAVSKDPFEEIMNSLNARSLFSNLDLIQIDQVEELDVKQQESLIRALKDKGQDLVVILSGSKAPSKLLAASLEMLVLDLSKEKPWDHKKRVIGAVADSARKAGKSIEYGAIEKLVEVSGLDLALLEQQVELLVCYTGARRNIVMSDLSVLSVAQKRQKTWAIADYFTFRQGEAPILEEMADSDFYSLLVQIRSRMNLAIKIKEGGSSFDLSESLLAKYTTWCQSLPKQYFVEGLLEIYNIERLSKTASFSTALLLDMLFIKLKNIKERRARG